jgi:TonB family protein
MVANITKVVKPVYPDIAKRASICGTVVLRAIVGKDGSVQELKYISGPPLLMKAALDAVRKWRYAPTLLQGQPVEVDTTISVVFELKGCKPIQPTAQPQAQEAPQQRPLGTLDSRPFQGGIQSARLAAATAEMRRALS